MEKRERGKREGVGVVTENKTEREKKVNRGERKEKKDEETWVRERTGLSIQTWPSPPYVPTPIW